MKADDVIRELSQFSLVGVLDQFRLSFTFAFLEKKGEKKFFCVLCAEEDGSAELGAKTSHGWSERVCEREAITFGMKTWRMRVRTSESCSGTGEERNLCLLRPGTTGVLHKH